MLDLHPLLRRDRVLPLEERWGTGKQTNDGKGNWNETDGLAGSLHSGRRDVRSSSSCWTVRVSSPFFELVAFVPDKYLKNKEEKQNFVLFNDLFFLYIRKYNY